MTIETLTRPDTFKNPVTRVAALEEAAFDLDKLYASIGVDEESRALMHTRNVYGSDDTDPITRRSIERTVRTVVEADVDATIAITHYNRKKLIAQRASAERARRFARKGDIFRAQAPKPNSIPARIR